MPSPEDILRDFTEKENERKRLENQTKIEPIKTDQINKSTQSVPSNRSINTPANSPTNPRDREPKVDTSAFARPVPTTGPLPSPLVSQNPTQSLGKRTIHIPPDFMTQLGVIFKEGGMDSRSQEKSLARVAELIDEYQEKDVFVPSTGGVRTEVLERNLSQRPLVPRTTGLTSPTGNQDNLPDIHHSDK